MSDETAAIQSRHYPVHRYAIRICGTCEQEWGEKGCDARQEGDRADAAEWERDALRAAVKRLRQRITSRHPGYAGDHNIWTVQFNQADIDALAALASPDTADVIEAELLRGVRDPVTGPETEEGRP